MKSRFAYLRTSQLCSLRVAYFGPKKSDKSLGDEKNYINKQEQDVLKNLLKKMKAQEEKAEMSIEK